MRDRFQRFMEGRYGNDQLNQCLSLVSLVLIVISIFVKFSVVWWIALALLVWMYFRMFSRNTSKRYAENERFLDFTSRFRRERRKQRKIYRFYVCPHCSQKVRVPKGKGRIEITCPKCRTTFIKRT